MTSALSFEMSRRNLLRGAAAGAGTLALATQSTSAPAAVAAGVTAATSFSADFPQSSFRNYLDCYPGGVTEGIDYGLVTDPFGSGRKVAFLDNSRGLCQGATKPRVAGETPRFVKPLSAGAATDEYWCGATVMVPSSVAAGMSGNDWFSILTPAYGPPFNGTSPLCLVLWPKSRTEVRVALGGDYHALGYEFTMPTDRWCRVLMNFKFAYDGWLRMWVGTGLGGTAWSPVPLRGVTKMSMPTMAHGVNDAIATDPKAQANSSRLSAYGNTGRLYAAHHALGTSQSWVTDRMR